MYILQVYLNNIYQMCFGIQHKGRWYWEVVLSDASTGHGPDTLARKLSRCKDFNCV